MLAYKTGVGWYARWPLHDIAISNSVWHVLR